MASFWGPKHPCVIQFIHPKPLVRVQPGILRDVDKVLSYIDASLRLDHGMRNLEPRSRKPNRGRVDRIPKYTIHTLGCFFPSNTVDGRNPANQLRLG